MNGSRGCRRTAGSFFRPVGRGHLVMSVPHRKKHSLEDFRGFAVNCKPRVLPEPVRAVYIDIFVGEVDAARERYAPVYRNDFSVVTEVDVSARERRQAVKHLDFCAKPFKFFDVAPRYSERRAYSVADNIHLSAVVSRLFERVYDRS